MASRKKKNKKSFVPLSLLVLVLIGLPVTVFLTRNQSNTRSQAAAPPNTTRYADFETGDFSQIQSGNPTLQAVNVNPSTSSVVIATDKAYEGSKSAQASIPGVAGNKYARTIFELTAPWTEGSDIWYGQAIYFPIGFKNSMQSYFVPMRWDNYGSSANDSRGGISMWSDKRFRLFRLHAGVDATETSLMGSFDISEGAWHWLEVHQKFSQTDGVALNEVYLDGALVGSSTAHNYFGVPITRLRNGIVAVDDSAQTNPLNLWIDRLTISTAKIGPYSTPSPTPTVSSSATPTPTSPPVLDTYDPTVTISSPLNGTRIVRSVNISAYATDNIRVTKLELYINGVLKTSNTNSNTISYTWNTKRTPLGAHNITIKAYDAAGNAGQSSVMVYK
ncbi:MAG TPA: Ig-like domain-containing protein [Xanthomonadales bacterium]|nr:Ig-like domain-containing protein [Xanthomonadales bacterium]